MVATRPKIVTNVVSQSLAGSSKAYYSPSDLISPFPFPEEDELVIAMHDFVPVTPNATCLSFRTGQVIRVLNKDPTGWWDGELVNASPDAKPNVVTRGWFPSNYVSSDTLKLVKEVLPVRKSSLSRTTMSTTPSRVSDGSLSSYASSSSYSFSLPTSSDPAPSRDAIPPVLHPLLHGLSLLQAAVQQSHASHYPPSAACIISCVRAILTDANCLQKDAARLRTFPELAQARKLLLADLAELVQYAQRAAAMARGEDDWEDLEESEDEVLESMLRTAGLVFTATRKFLALLEQCGISIPSWRMPHGRRPSIVSRTSISSGSRSRGESSDSDGPDNDRSRSLKGPGVAIGSPSQDDITVNAQQQRQSAFHRARSMTDLRKSRAPSNSNATPRANNTPRHSRYPTNPSLHPTDLAIGAAPLTPDTDSPVDDLVIKNGGHTRSGSISSSASSLSSFATPPTPPFPSGPCTAEQVLSTLRVTQDHLLSTVAAFIGHVHNYSRAAHSTSKGNIIYLATETVERVKMMLAIVDSVLKDPEVVETVAQHKRSALSNAKYNLFVLTNEVVQFVRSMTTPGSLPEEEEQEEKSKTLNAATGVIRAGRECFYSVNIVLSRAAGEPAFRISLPNSDPLGIEEKKHAHKQSLGSIHENLPSQSITQDGEAETSHDMDMEEEQDTFRPETTEETDDAASAALIRQESTSTVEDDTDYGNDDSLLSFDSSEADEGEDDEEISRTPAPEQSTSPIVVDPPTGSESHSDENGSVWERQPTPSLSSLEEKILHGDLPSVPMSPPPSAKRNSLIDSSVGHEASVSLTNASPDIMFNNDGLIVGATLKALMERMTPDDVAPDASFSAVFFLTFRFFTSPTELLDHLILRHSIPDSVSQNSEEAERWQRSKGFPIRIRVSNFIKTWLENYWRAEVDNEILPRLLEFVKNELAPTFAIPAARIQELIRTRMKTLESSVQTSPALLSTRTKSIDRLKEVGSTSSPISPSEIPRPQITKSLFNQLRIQDYSGVHVTDFDVLELARQLTILENTLYRAVQPYELLEIGQSGASPATNVKAISTLSTAVTGWVTECVLSEQDTKKRASLLKFFIKLAERCSRLNNFSTPWSILAALNSATISRLTQTWTVVPQKQRAQFEQLRKLADHGRNYAEYRSRLRNTAAPAVPFLGLYLTDITFCREGNPSHRSSPGSTERRLINFNKYHKLARIVQDMQRFQSPFTLKEITEVQQYLKAQLDVAKNAGDLQDLYRRSLVVEPRQPADVPPSGEIRQLFGWTTKSTAQSQRSVAAATQS